MCDNCKTYCHSCGAESDWYCEKCEKCVCEKCTVPFTQTNNIDYTLCNNCHDFYQEEYAEARTAYEKALACPNVDADSVNYNFAILLKREGKPEEALKLAAGPSAFGPPILR